jgi:hypothetical protein
LAIVVVKEVAVDLADLHVAESCGACVPGMLVPAQRLSIGIDEDYLTYRKHRRRHNNESAGRICFRFIVSRWSFVCHTESNGYIVLSLGIVF